jgi:dephospho-CoA kinase
MAKCLGITGGIGAGKTTISRIFQSLGVPVFDADAEAKDSYNDAEVQKKITLTFGEGIFIDQKLQPKILASKVFAFPDQLKKLEAIIHPLVHERWEKFAQLHSEMPYIIRENAILIQSGGHLTCDKVLLITAPLENRIARVMSRSKLSREAIEDRIQHQWSDEQLLPFVHFVIENKHNPSPDEALIPQVIQMDKWMKS